jgi:hypothetical protein
VRRAGLIAAGVVGAALIAGAGLWLAVFRDTAEPVSVDDAVTSFRTDAQTNPAAPSPIPEGVYVYATAGYEKTDALTGVTHGYPSRSTISVAAADCGMSLTWRVLKGRSTVWTICVADAGWSLRSQDERHTFFGRTQSTTYVCDSAPVRPADASRGSRWAVACATDGAVERGFGTFVGRERLRVAGPTVIAAHVRKTTRLSGAIRGTSRYEFWFHERIGVPVKIVMVSHTTNDSPVGDVHYDESVTLRLLSLAPRR